MLGELDQPREQRARILWRRLGQSVVLSFSCLRCLVSFLLAFVAVTLPCTVCTTAPLVQYQQWWKSQAFDGNAEADALGFG